jgi:hypothetical protein
MKVECHCAACAKDEGLSTAQFYPRLLNPLQIGGIGTALST